jgi:hypothetical protein
MESKRSISRKPSILGLIFYAGETMTFHAMFMINELFQQNSERMNVSLTCPAKDRDK